MARRRLPGPATVGLFLLCLAPLAWIVWDAATGGLGANPVQALSRRTGDWALRLLILTLAVTPLRRMTGWSWLQRHRRTLGLAAFFYAVLHVANYLVLDQWFAWSEIAADILERPWVTVGTAAFLLLVPLAATSTRAAQRRLGGRRWKRLHRAVYPAAVLGVLHFLWLVKADLRPPLIHGAVLAAVLLLRLPVFRVRAPRSRTAHAGAVR